MIPSLQPRAPLAYATTAVAISAVSLVSPALPELAASYGVSVSEVAAIQIAVLVPGIVSARWLLGAGARRGLPQMLSWTLLLYGATGGLLVWVEHWPTVLAIRLVQGFVGGGLLAGAFALLSNSGDREGLIARNAALVCGMMATQPLIGSALATLGPRAPFAFYLTAVPLGLLMLGAARRNLIPSSSPSAPPPPARKPSVAKSLALTVMINLLLFGWLLYLAPVLLQGEHGMSVQGRGALLSSQALLAGLLALTVTRAIRRGREGGLLYGGLAASMVGLAAVLMGPATAVVVAGFVLLGTIYGTANPAVISLITRHGRHATGAWQSSARIGQVGGPALAAWLLARVGTHPTVMVGMAVAALGLVTLSVPLRSPKLDRILVGKPEPESGGTP